MALGEGPRICARVRNAFTPELKILLLKAPAQVAARVTTMRAFVAEKWSSEVLQKWTFYQQIPHKIVGGFGGYMGFPLSVAKACIAECFDEFEATADSSQHDPVSVHLLSLENATGQQLKAFHEEPTKPLHSYPEAFVSLQEYAFVPCSERYVEGEHVKTKISATRTLKFSRPAGACARKRKGQVIEMIESPPQLDFLISHWHCRTIHRELLAHLATPAEVDNMSVASRLARIYGYAPEDTFKNVQKEAHQVEVLTAIEGVLQQSAPVPTTQSASLILDFLKSRLEIRRVFSVPRELFGIASPGAVPIDPEAIADADLIKALGLPDPMADDPVEACVFFQILDPRPEAKTQVRTKHVGLKRSLVVVKTLPAVAGPHGKALLLMKNTDPIDIDLLQWTTLANFRDVMGRLKNWVCTHGGIGLQVCTVRPSGFPVPKCRFSFSSYRNPCGCRVHRCTVRSSVFLDAVLFL